MLWNWALAVCIHAPAGHSILPQERMAWIGIWKVSIRLLPGCAAVQGSRGPRIRRIAIGQVVCGGTGARWHIPMGKGGAAWARDVRERAGRCLLV